MKGACVMKGAAYSPTFVNPAMGLILCSYSPNEHLNPGLVFMTYMLLLISGMLKIPTLAQTAEFFLKIS